MKKMVTNITILLLLGLVLCEIHMVILKFFPQVAAEEYANWFDKNYKERLSIIWYIYEFANIVNKIIWSFCFVKVADLVSHRLANVLTVFLFYYITQLIFYVWNRNTTLFSNFIVYIYIGIAIIFLFIPAKKGGKLINLEDYPL